MLQIAGLLVTGAGAVLGFEPNVRESTMWMLWGGGGLLFLFGTSLVRRGH